MKPETRPLGRVNPRAGFNNYVIDVGVVNIRRLIDLTRVKIDG
jgi:hypothetical protein